MPSVFLLRFLLSFWKFVFFRVVGGKFQNLFLTLSVQTATQTTPVGYGSPNRLPVWGKRSGFADDIFKKAFIHADSWLVEILAKFHIHVKEWATVDAHGNVIILLPDDISREIYPEAMITYTGVGFCSCRPTWIGQCEKPRPVGRWPIQIPTLFLYKPI